MNAWTSEQTRMLSVLGYTLYRRAGNEPALAVAAISAVDAPAMPAATLADRGNDPLWLALRRAANGAELDALVIDLAALRHRPDEKRALWPRLRALRRARRASGGSAPASVADDRMSEDARRSR